MQHRLHIQTYHKHMFFYIIYWPYMFSYMHLDLCYTMAMVPAISTFTLLMVNGNYVKVMVGIPYPAKNDLRVILKQDRTVRFAGVSHVMSSEFFPKETWTKHIQKLWFQDVGVPKRVAMALGVWFIILYHERKLQPGCIWSETGGYFKIVLFRCNQPILWYPIWHNFSTNHVSSSDCWLCAWSGFPESSGTRPRARLVSSWSHACSEPDIGSSNSTSNFGSMGAPFFCKGPKDVVVWCSVRPVMMAMVLAMEKQTNSKDKQCKRPWGLSGMSSECYLYAKIFWHPNQPGLTTYSET